MKKIPFDDSIGYQIVLEWLANKGQQPFTFQYKAWKFLAQGKSGMVIAPTGFGKTFSVFLGVLIDAMNRPDEYDKGLKLIWITPLRSLAKDLARAMQEAIDQIGLDWTVEVRNGDTDAKNKARQSKNMPDVLLLTPESMHLLLAQKSRDLFFKNIKFIAVDEWHELLGTKRGVMVELAVAFLRKQYPYLSVWGITATIGNLEQAAEVLNPNILNKVAIRATEKKKIEIVSVFPDEVEVLPWAGHLGGHLVEKVIPVIMQSKSTILFTNTRNQSENWYQILLNASPELAGQMALHHSSIDGKIRQWIEEALSNGQLKVVVSTSSLDLGVDFKPVDTIIQIGSSKGVARFMQRAGRSGHSPHEVSKIYFVPTHSLELFEVAALKDAVKTNTIESREPLVLTYDVLVQFMVTIALGGGFKGDELYKVIEKTHAFNLITEEEWNWCLQFITVGGAIGKNYEEFHKVTKQENGLYVVDKRRIGMLHRMNMGVIVSDAMMKVKFSSGGYIGMVEEYFITKLKPGDKFVLAGRVLEYVRTKELTVMVKGSSGKAITPSWVGGRLPLTSNLSAFLRKKLAMAQEDSPKDIEIKFLKPLIEVQKQKSRIPLEDELLIEHIRTKEGDHLFFYPFEGRLVHEVMATLIAFRISKLLPISFSIAMNDYGFELFTDIEFEFTPEQYRSIFDREHLMQDVAGSINAAEMARHKFRDIAVIAGLVVQNSYGKQRNNKSLQSSSGIIFKVLEEYEPGNLLVRQAYDEVFNQQLEEPRLIAAFNRIAESKIVYQFSKTFTPLSFPIKVDSLRQSLSSEDLMTRIEKIKKKQVALPNKKK